MKQILMNICVVLLLYLIAILMSFDIADPSWMQHTWNGSVCNVGGVIGARISDFLFFIFGEVAYIIPVFLICCIWKINSQISVVTASRVFLRFLIVLILLLILCGLMQIILDDVKGIASGGIVGCVMYNFFCKKLVFYCNVILLSLILISVIYFYRTCFFYVMNKIYKKIVCIILNIFLNNKNDLYYNVRDRQTFFKRKIVPIVFSSNQYFLYKRAEFYNELLVNKCFNKDVNLNFNCIDDLNVTSKNTINTLKPVIDNNYDYNYNNNKYIMKCYLYKSYLRTPSVNCVNRSYRYKKIVNKIRFRKINNRNVVYQCTKVISNNSKIFDLLKKTIVNNTSISISNVNRKPSDVISIKSIKPLTSTNVNNISKPQIFKFPQRHNYLEFKKIDKSNHSSSVVTLPDINCLLLNTEKSTIDYSKLKATSYLIEKKLCEYRITACVEKIIVGPVITRFELNLSAGIKSSKITNLSRDLARALSVSVVRVIEVIPGTSYVGLEIPNIKRNTVYLRDIIDSDQFRKHHSPLSVVFGKNIFGEPVIEDLRHMPHLLVAGTTGSGKSMGINVMIISILYKANPEDVRFIMIDPKILELSVYSDIPHLLREIITDSQDAESVLQWCVEEMEYRYKLMSKYKVRNLESYNRYVEEQHMIHRGNLSSSMNLLKQPIQFNDIQHSNRMLKKLPYIVVIIEEFSDLMLINDKKIELLITKLTQKARAAGIHLILSTQRPSVDVITGLIKSNIPARIAFTVSSKIDSRTILDQSGAESLLGMGDMLYLPSNSSMLVRVHGACVKDQEIRSVVKFWKDQASDFNLLRI